jgi:hypothetical protein
MRTIEELAYGVLSPVLLNLVLPDPVIKFLDRGGKALLFGETGAPWRKSRQSVRNQPAVT